MEKLLTEELETEKVHYTLQLKEAQVKQPNSRPKPTRCGDKRPRKRPARNRSSQRARRRKP